MYWTLLFIIIMMVGCYFVYVKPKKDILNKLRADPAFSHYILVIESNAEFDAKSHDKAMKHLRIFMMYFSQAFEDEAMYEKMRNQHRQILKYLNRMLLSIPNSMKRYNYMKNAVENIDEILMTYTRQIADRYGITFTRA
jgi:hypothetical protein